MCDKGGKGPLGRAVGYSLTWRAVAAPRPGGPGGPFLLCIFQAGYSDHRTPGLASPGAYGRAHALPESHAPRWRPATADLAPSAARVADPLPPRPLGSAEPERSHRTCRARRTETTIPGRQCASVQSRCGAMGGAAGCAGKRRSVRKCEGRCWHRACARRGLEVCGKEAECLQV